MKAIVTLIAVMLATSVLAKDGQYLTYDDLIRQVESGNIQSVTLDQFSSISGVMAEGGTTNTFRSYAGTGSANDPLLTKFLKDHGVSVSMRDVTKPSHAIPMLTGFMFMGAPIVFLILLILIIWKLNLILRNQKSNQQPPAN